MTLEFHIPHTLVADLSRASVESYLPDEVNFDLVEVSGGSRNVVGEYTGSTETRSSFRAFLTQSKDQRAQRQGAEGEEGEFTLFYLFEDVLDGVDRGVSLSQNDLVEEMTTSKRYEIVEVSETEFGTSKPWGQAKVRGPKG